MNIDNIYAVIVLYNCSLKESSTVKTINKALLNANKVLNVLVYDNSLLAQETETNFVYKNLNCEYIHNPKNPGLVDAYNLALNKLNINNKQWLLLLDQDTHFSKDFFVKINNVEINNTINIGALIPTVVSLNKKHHISPMRMKRGGLVKKFNSIKPGIINEKNITGINSGALLSSNFLKILKKFDEKFPLDMLDHWYFREIHRNKYSIYLLNTTIHQELSIHNMETQMNVDRYTNMIKSEKLFLNDSLQDKLIFKSRLIFRLVKQLTYKNKAYFFSTFKNL